MTKKKENTFQCCNCFMTFPASHARTITKMDGKLGTICSQFLCKQMADKCDYAFGKPKIDAINWYKVAIADVLPDATVD